MRLDRRPPLTGPRWFPAAGENDFNAPRRELNLRFNEPDDPEVIEFETDWPDEFDQLATPINYKNKENGLLNSLRPTVELGRAMPPTLAVLH